MDNYSTAKEVYFHHWCQFCVHCKDDENQLPCNDCLAQGWNEDSRRPIFFKKNPDKEKVLERIAEMYEHEMKLQEEGS